MNQINQTPTGTGTGLAPNIASVLAYICMPIIAIVLILLKEENEDVKFHSWQGAIFGVAIVVLMVAFKIAILILGLIWGVLASILGILGWLLFLGVLILWVICLVKAYNGERWRIPVLGDIAAKKAGQV